MEPSPGTSGVVERRRHKRYRVKGETFAFLGDETGTLLDISQGGFSFHFAVFEKEPVIPSHLDIFLAEPHFYLPKIPVSFVSEIQTVPASIFSLLRIKRLGMKFGLLSREQQALVEEFIARHTVTEN